MKNSHLSEKLENRPELMETIDREKVMKALGKLGFISDYESKYVTILRNSRFPFKRIALPTINSIHIELLKLYAADLGIPVNHLLNLLK